ncbi:MAG TPA: FAD-linked oxidase C-terminal domain-containing protein [Candidatus Binatia bacterium]|nr:FAD-linked oxidase C-terminal domain-containing protein [Candidatus Binatia bacterium]
MKSAAALAELKRLLKPGELRCEEAVRRKYAGDKWFAARVPDAVALPKSTESVSKILRFASARKIPVTARGAGFGYVGGCVPSRGGIVLALERMKRIKEIHKTDFVAVVEAGVITKTLQDAVEKRGLFYPPDPASRADCSIGGNIATNAGGPRCLKYGVTRDYVLGLEVVLADGSILRLGSRTHKNKTGFELARLFVGSEGLLGVVTGATLKLLPLPPDRAALSVGFGSLRSATGAINAIFGAGFLPAAVELADAFTVAAAQKRTGSKRLKGCHAHLIVELDGQPSSVRQEIQSVARIVKSFQPLFIENAAGSKECEKLWQIRREFSYSLRDTGLTKLNQDVVVPRSKLQDIFALGQQLQKKHGFPVACFGHAGDGNIHCNIMVDFNQANAKRRSDAALDDLFQGVLALGGAITGEHGIGLAKKRWWPLATTPEIRALHAKLKSMLDPAGILNPGKFV